MGNRRIHIGSAFAMFVVFFAALLLLAWRNEDVNRRSIERHDQANQRSIERHQDAIERIENSQEALSRAIRENCEARARNVTKLNLGLPADKKLVVDDCSRYRYP